MLHLLGSFEALRSIVCIFGSSEPLGSIFDQRVVFSDLLSQFVQCLAVWNLFELLRAMFGSLGTVELLRSPFGIFGTV